VVIVAGVVCFPSPGDAVSTTSQYTFIDASRPTPCTGATDRTLQVTVVTPATAGPSPVMLLAPGSGASQRAVARADAAAWAARGYVGVALDFPCTNAPGQSTSDPTVALDVYHQPADVSFVTTELLALSASPGNELSGLLDPERIGYVGTSSGAITGFFFFNSCCGDTRIRAMELTKGFPAPTAAGLPLSGSYDWSRPIATYLWNGCLDLVPYAPAAGAYGLIGPPKALLTDPNGTHDTTPIFPAGTTDAFMDRFVAGDVSAATAAPFPAARNDTSFAYDLGAPLPAQAATTGCAAPVSAETMTVAPRFTG
jgi:hypothetical protein